MNLEMLAKAHTLDDNIRVRYLYDGVR